MIDSSAKPTPPAVQQASARSPAREASSAPDRQPDVFELQYRTQLDSDHDGVVSPAEFARFGSVRSSVGWIPLASILSTERRLAIDSPQFATTQQRLARTLVKARGTANQDDVEAVVAHLGRLPASVLVGLQRAGMSVTVCRGGVADCFKDLKKAPVRGHDAKETWETVPGTSLGNQVVVATVENPRLPGQRMVPARGDHHGSHNVLLHELGHGLVRHLGLFHGLSVSKDAIDASATAPFLAAREQDWERLAPYYQQNGKAKGAGADETFAESFARFYGGDPTLELDWPALYRFWNESGRSVSPAPGRRR